jgi:D-sedoheptulose 7-phosphate isomerase
MSLFNKSQLFQRYPNLEACKEQLGMALELLKNSFESGGKLLVMGNGGSSADAEHFCGELVKGFVLKRELLSVDRNIYDKIDPAISENLQYGLPAISLGVSHSLISAYSNDISWDFAFAQQVHVMANKNDIVFGITTSGNSKNVVWALKVAKAKGVKVISLTGASESLCSGLSDITIRVPKNMTHEVQELHLPVYHALALELEYYFYAK